MALIWSRVLLKGSLLFSVLTVHHAVNAASFDCRQATTKTEVAICSNKDISLLDDSLSRWYKEAISITPNPDLLRASQRSWLKKRNNCLSLDCLKASYHSRVNELQAQVIGLRELKTPSSPSDKFPNQFLLPPHSSVEKYSVAQWGERFWMWLLSSPNEHNPALDQSGEKCQWGQKGNVWFLAGTYKHYPIFRHCSIPEGMYLYIPIYTGIVRPLPQDTQANCSYSLGKSKRATDAITHPFLSINGHKLPGIRNHRETSRTCIDPSGTGRTISAVDAYAVMLKPLPKGQYIVRYGNEAEDDSRHDVTVVLDVIEKNSSQISYPDTRPLIRHDANGFPTQMSYSMPEAPGFDYLDVSRRIYAVIASNPYYEIVSNNTPGDKGVRISFIPRNISTLVAKYPDMKNYFMQPMSIHATHDDLGTATFEVSSLPSNDSPSFRTRAALTRDAQNFLINALDKNTPIKDSAIAEAIFAERRPWETIIRGLPGK